MLGCCGGGGPQIDGSYMGLSISFNGAGGFRDIAIGSFPAAPQWRRYLSVTERLQSLTEATAWRQATYSYPPMYPGTDDNTWMLTAGPLLNGAPTPTVTITTGAGWGTVIPNFTLSNSEATSVTDSVLTMKLNFDGGLPNGGWQWTVTLSNPVQIGSDFATAMAWFSAFPDDQIGTHPPFITGQRHAESRHYNATQWVQGTIVGQLFAASHGARARFHHSYNWRGKTDFGSPVLLGGAHLLMTSYVEYTFMEMKRRLDSPFSTTARCKYTYKTTLSYANNPLAQMECIQDSFTAHQVTRPPYFSMPADYTYAKDSLSLFPSGTRYISSGQNRTMLIPPDTDPLVGTPACCNPAP